MTHPYIQLCERYNVKWTLYVTGRTLADQWEALRPVVTSPLVEIGGHTYSGLSSRVWSKLWARLTGKVACSHSSSCGTFANQKRDVERMATIALSRLGKPIVLWRSLLPTVNRKESYE